MQDYYTLLNVKKDADTNEIKSSYRKLMFIYHPDHAKTPDKAEQFHAIQEAYNCLMDENQRALYDKRCNRKREVKADAEKIKKEFTKEVEKENNTYFIGMLGAMTLFVVFSYIVLSKESALFPHVYPISTLTVGFIGMSIVLGTTVGACLAFLNKLPKLNVLEEFISSNRNVTVSTLFILASIQFWAGYIYVLLCYNKNPLLLRRVLRAFHFLVSGTLIVTFSAMLSSNISFLQSLIWGGSIITLGFLIGWISAEAYNDYIK